MYHYNVLQQLITVSIHLKDMAELWKVMSIEWDETTRKRVVMSAIMVTKSETKCQCRLQPSFYEASPRVRIHFPLKSISHNYRLLYGEESYLKMLIKSSLLNQPFPKTNDFISRQNESKNYKSTWITSKNLIYRI